MKTSQIAGAFGFGALMFLAGYAVPATQGGTWVLFSIISLVFLICVIVGWTE